MFASKDIRVRCHQHKRAKASTLIVEALVQFRRVHKILIRVQLEQDKAHQRLVQFQERHHDTEVDIRRNRLREHVWHEPRNFLPVHDRLEVDALDAQKHLAKAVRAHHIQLPLGTQSRTVGGDLGRHALLRRNIGEQEERRKCII